MASLHRLLDSAPPLEGGGDRGLHGTFGSSVANANDLTDVRLSAYDPNEFYERTVGSSEISGAFPGGYRAQFGTRFPFNLTNPTFKVPKGIRGMFSQVPRQNHIHQLMIGMKSPPENIRGITGGRRPQREVVSADVIMNLPMFNFAMHQKSTVVERTDAGDPEKIWGRFYLLGTNNYSDTRPSEKISELDLLGEEMVTNNDFRDFTGTRAIWPGKMKGRRYLYLILKRVDRGVHGESSISRYNIHGLSPSGWQTITGLGRDVVRRPFQLVPYSNEIDYVPLTERMFLDDEGRLGFGHVIKVGYVADNGSKTFREKDNRKDAPYDVAAMNAQPLMQIFLTGQH